MRLHFPNMSRPKQAAKRISTGLSVSLSSAQRAVARSSGYRDWHELEGQVQAGPPCILDESLSPDQYIERQTLLILAIARELSLPDGDVQYVLGDARLVGNRPANLEEQLALRLACARATTLPIVQKRERGAVGVLNTTGRKGETVILRTWDQPTSVVSNREVSTVADFEYTSPRASRSLFLPMRLYLPYGFWTEADGARVLFSRDYKPMWRLHTDRPVERLDPWLRIKYQQQTFLWPDHQTPWTSNALHAQLVDFLEQHNLCRLPVLADALPLLVHDRSIRDLRMANGAELLREEYGRLGGRRSDRGELESQAVG